MAIQLAWQRTLYRGLVTLIVSLSTVCIFWFGGYQVASGIMSAGELVAFLFYAENITRSLTIFTQLYGKYREADGASNRIFELFDMRSSLTCPEHYIRMPPRLDSIEFANVSFRYDEGQPVLDGLDFKIRQGDVVALVGASGAGKSTVAQLLLRLYDVTSGSVLLNGVDIREVDAEWLRGHVSLVLPNGYDTLLGERGVNLSGGQRQRLALARSLLVEPRLRHGQPG